MLRRSFLKSFAAGTLAAAIPGCKPHTAASRPNILFAIADDASYPHMGAYGCTWVKTPAFDRIAREGILFTNCYTPNAKCAPSRACILTGRNSWQLEEAANHWCYFPKKFTTYAEALAENGWHVGYVAKGWAPGVAGEIDGKKRQLTGAAYNSKKLTPPTSHINSSDYAANFKDFLNDKSPEQPFCFWYGCTEPHRAYEYGSGSARGGKIAAEIEKVPDFWPDNETVRNDMLDYAFELEWFDSHLEKMLELLEERGELDNTIVVATADNGMPFPRIKGQDYEYSNHLPLAIMWKNGIKNPGRTVDDFVSFIDFAPTWFEAAQLDESDAGMQRMSGKSLMPIFRAGTSGVIDPTRDHVLLGKERHDIGRPRDQGYPIRGIVKGEWLYIHNFETDRRPAGDPQTGYLNCDGSPTKTEILDSRRKKGKHTFWNLSFGKRPAEELYNISMDRECMQNLAKNPIWQKKKEALKDQLFTKLKEQNDPRMFGNGKIFDDYPYADEKHRHFYEKYQQGDSLKAGWVNVTDFEPNFPQ